MIKIFNSLIVTMFSLGKIKFAPGTFGSFATTIILFYLFHILNISSNIILIGWIIIFIYSFHAVSEYIKNNKNKDPKEIVIDEFIGQSIPLIFMSEYIISSKNPLLFFLAFFLFRFFDILKPFPINIIDKKMKNGLGVVLDDIIAGIYTSITILIFGYVYAFYYEY